MPLLFRALGIGFGVFLIAIATLRLFVRPMPISLWVAQIVAGVLIALIPTARKWFVARVPQRPPGITKLPKIGVVGAFVLIAGFYAAASVGLLELGLEPPTVVTVARGADIAIAIGIALSGIGVLMIWRRGRPRPLSSGPKPSDSA